MIIDSTDSTFQEDIKREGNILVDFWAGWCGPCINMTPVLKMLEEKNPELTIIKVNVDENSQLSTEYEVKSLPTFLLIRDGKVIDRKIGSVSLVVLQSMIDSE